MNTETLVHPKLQHIGLLTGNLQRLVDWYKHVLGIRPIHAGDNPTGAPAGSPPSLLKADFTSNDEISHRLVLIEIPELTADPERARHQRVQHFAFEFLSLDDLLGGYARLKALGIVPVMSVDEGPQTSFYYNDPDLTFSRSMPATTEIAGRRSSTCKHCRSSRAGRSASSSTPTR